MNLSQLLSLRPELLRQVRLVHLAHAYQTLRDFAFRVDRARLRGTVELKPVSPDEEVFCVTLTALDFNQSLVEEHFGDDDLLLLADVLGFITGAPTKELTFRIERLEEFFAPLRTELAAAGVTLDDSQATASQPL
jgi:hypothetical protein